MEHGPIAGELRRLDLDAFGEGADACLVARSEPVDERGRGLGHEAIVAAHAAAAVEQHHQADRLDVVGENGQRLRLAALADLEHLATQVRDKASVLVSHRGVDGDGPGAAAERRLTLFLRGQEHAGGGGDKQGGSRFRSVHGRSRSDGGNSSPVVGRLLIFARRRSFWCSPNRMVRGNIPVVPLARCLTPACGRPRRGCRSGSHVGQHAPAPVACDPHTARSLLRRHAHC